MTSTIKERPILFSGPMVRAILEGKKSVTRRPVKGLQIPKEDKAQGETRHRWSAVGQRDARYGFCVFGETEEECAMELGEFGACPYGRRGYRMWVREEHYRFGHWEEVPGVRTKTGRQKWRFVGDSTEVRYQAPDIYRKGRHHHDPATPAWHKRLSRFMPKAASRILLEITAVRVERLQGISTEQIIAEGLSTPLREEDAVENLKMQWLKLWIDINGAESWHANPWCWVVEFKRISSGITSERT